MTPTEQDKELRYKIAELMFLKLGIDMGRTDTQYPLLPTSDRDEFLEDVTALFALHLQAYADEIRREVIGENETVNDIENPSWDDMRRQAATLGKNQLKALQHKALNTLAIKWGVKL